MVNIWGVIITVIPLARLLIHTGDEERLTPRHSVPLHIPGARRTALAGLRAVRRWRAKHWLSEVVFKLATVLITVANV